MIKFPCRCSHVFSVTEDQAGGVIQCPKCGRLNDVPTLGDLNHLNDDGTLKIADEDELQPAGDDRHRLAELHRIYTRSHVDEEGNEIDLRQTMDDVLRSGVKDEDPRYEDGQPRDVRPKYDPVTGELVREIELKPPEDDRGPYEMAQAGGEVVPLANRAVPTARVAQPAIPMAKPAINYATVDLGKSWSASRIAIELLMMQNFVVLMAIYVIHVFALMPMFAAAGGLFFIAPVILIMVFLLLAHYAGVVDETGREEKDELPRPLRSLGWYEDLWGPFTQFFGALIICYGPAVMVAGFLPKFLQVPVLFALLGAGTVVFPAVFLTLVSSGSVYNLRPDRVLGVMKACGGKYVFAVLLWIAAWFVYCWGAWAILVGTALFFVSTKLQWVWYAHPAVAFPGLLVGVYLMHYFCWFLGLLYRGHHSEFPWILQFHSRKREAGPVRRRPMGVAGVPPHIGAPRRLPKAPVHVISDGGPQWPGVVDDT